MKLYYGSQTLFEKPIYGFGNTSNDYGLGFYLTDSPSLAELWACQYEQGGYVLDFSLNLSGLSILELSENDEISILKWITLLVKHRFSYQERLNYLEIINWLERHFDTPINDFDIIIGYRADDSYFHYSHGFVAGLISIETLAKAMKLGKLGLQYVLISKNAFNKIEFSGYHVVSHKNDYTEFREKTLDEYHQLLNQEDRFNNTFIGELMKKYGR